MKDVFFHIITPVYNVEKYLEACVTSVVNQGYQYYELILIDDGSTDKSGIICDRFAFENEHIKVIHQENKGQLATRQAGINKVLNSNMSGEFLHFFVFLDSDDMLKSDSLEKISSIIVQKGCDIIIYSMERVDETGNVVPGSISSAFDGVVVEKKVLYRIVLTNDQYNSLCRKVVNVNIVKEANYNEFLGVRHGEDLIHSLRLLDAAQSVCFISDVLYQYRDNPNSVTKEKISANRIVEFGKLYSYEFSFLKELGIFSESEMLEFVNHSAFCLLGILNCAWVRNSKKERRAILNSCVNSAICNSIAEKADSSLWPLRFMKIGNPVFLFTRFWFGLRRLKRILNMDVREY